MSTTTLTAEARGPQLTASQFWTTIACVQKLRFGPVAIPKPCEWCHNLRVRQTPVKAGYRRDDFRTFIRSKHDFETGSANGCRWCTAVVQTLDRLKLTPLHYQRVVLFMFKRGGCQLSMPMARVTVQFYTPNGFPPVWDGITQGYEMSTSGDVHQTAEFIRFCIRNCDETHPLCKPQSPTMPTRVIYVGNAEDTQVRLVETAQIHPTPYTALSYCWGKSGNFVTTKVTIDDHKKALNVDDFPQTVRDAVEITRGLGLKYLWVDAICIIQDSAEDWEKEASKMASVYSDAYFTISAATAHTSTEGFISQKHEVALQQQPFRMNWRTDRGKRSILAARVIPEADDHVKTITGDRKPKLPLMTRGWTLQEELLSRRTVTYTEHELWWTCQTERDCECHTFNEVSTNTQTTLFSPKDMTSPQVAFGQWRDLVSEFFQRQLTFGSDRLPALSGLATVFQHKTGSPYIAGLWKDNLINDLLWYTPKRRIEELDDANTQDRVNCHIPTFSWASAGGQVDFFKGPYVEAGLKANQWAPKAVVVDASTTSSNNNPLGNVTAGHIALRGRVKEATLEVVITRRGRFRSYAIENNGESVNFHPDARLERFQLGMNGTTKGEDASVRRSPARSEIESACAESPVMLLHLGDWAVAERKLVDMTYLVLGRSPTDTSKFERLGLAYQQVQHGCEGDIIGDAWQGDVTIL
ncbi:heterokaryon incompatibility protein [Colletotrichum nymphaeae SA-01]|uniref:Heterokaryon incompatibility protein n=1 Tax=Colletotrichum nymphaeae SA-01 TaxID=1460502 RepID=A0A135TQU3_9PEZI|nr:heterokaryon incompatibility protein [Colletotrichum nymphaeae SA-01]